MTDEFVGEILDQNTTLKLQVKLISGELRDVREKLFNLRTDYARVKRREESLLDVNKKLVEKIQELQAAAAQREHCEK